MIQSKAMKKIIIAAFVILAVCGWLYFVKGYVGIRTNDSVPADLINEAVVPGAKNVRILLDPIHIEKSKLQFDIYRSGLSRPVFHKNGANVLAISGGGANGAYAAGILCGWTEFGNRPAFDIVTGVSTGALIAPCAFLGPSYDHVLRDIYTNVSDADVLKQDITEFLFGGRPSLVDTSPLEDILETTVTMDVMKEVAREHARGRRLYITTTNLDARRLVLWDMGAIASIGTPEALELFRSVMLASASIPVAFPPVMITVEAGGELYDEMHVDGSIGTQIFGALLIVGPIREDGIKPNVFLIRNGKLADSPGEVKFKIWDIAGAAFATLVTWQSYGDLDRFSLLAKEGDINLYMTFIPYDFNTPRKGEFDTRYMRKLFEVGYEAARSGDQWETVKDGNILQKVRFEKMR